MSMFEMEDKLTAMTGSEDVLNFLEANLTR